MIQTKRQLLIGFVLKCWVIIMLVASPRVSHESISILLLFFFFF